MPITISICDDDAELTAFLRDLLNVWAQDKSLVLNINEYESSEQFMFCYPDDPCDLLLLDIEMPGINGMELAKKLRAEGDMLPIIFITGYSEYMQYGYDVEALHYLLKPVEKSRLYMALDKYVDRITLYSDEILVPTAEGSTHISPNDIMYIEAQGRKTCIHLKSFHIECTLGISRLEDKKLTGFVRCHRSFIVNLRFVRSIGRTELTLDNGVEIPLSRRLFGEFNKKFIEFYTKG